MNSKTNSIIGHEISPEMKKDIDIFKYKFKIMHGITPYVSITSKGLYVGEISMRELLQITNQAREECCAERFSAGIMSKTRLKPVVMYRQAFCKVASNLGYGCTSIGKFLDKNHATIVYSIKNVENLISVGDIDMQTCVDEIYSRIEPYLLKRENGQDL